jgi:NAD(P)H-quinone oxidoreductase subunit I
MLKDISLAFVQQPVTERYPRTRRPTPEKLRGHLHWNPDNCTGCGLCVTDCPSAALALIVLDKKARRFVLHYQVDRCTFCAQCVQSCRHGCLWLAADEWELAALKKDDFEVYFGEEEDVREALA